MIYHRSPAIADNNLFLSIYCSPGVPDTSLLLSIWLVLLTSYTSQVQRDLQVGPEGVGKVRVDIQDLQQVLPEYTVEVTVGDGVHVGARLARLVVQVNGLPEDVVLFCKRNTWCLVIRRGSR